MSVALFVWQTFAMHSMLENMKILTTRPGLPYACAIVFVCLFVCVVLFVCTLNIDENYAH